MMKRWQKDSIRKLKQAAKAAENSILNSTIEEATTQGEIDIWICQRTKNCTSLTKIFVPMQAL
jgi:hypothetical protein